MIKHEKEGFTLIELLIVIGIIAILAAAIIVSINPGRQFREARNSTRWSHMNSIANGIYSYAVANNGVFPPGCPTSTYTATTTVNDTNCGVLTTDGHISILPTPPLTGEVYWIKFNTADLMSIRIGSTATEASGVEVVQ